MINNGLLSVHVYRFIVSTNFRLELVEPSAREVEGQQFFLALSLAIFFVV